MNSAYELASVFERLAKTEHRNSTIGARWAFELNCAEGSSEFFMALACMQAKMETLRQQLIHSALGERAKGLYTKAVDQLINYVKANQIQLQVNELKGKADQINILFLAAETLPHELVPEVNRLTIDAIIAELEELIEATTCAEMDVKLRQIIVNQLSTLLMVMRSYGVLGPDGAAKIFGSVAAELLRVSGSAVAQEAVARKSLTKAKAIVTKTAAAIILAGGTVSGAYAFLSDGGKLIDLVEGGGSPTATDAP